MNDTLYVSDLDGTLMRNNEKLSEYTIKTLNELLRQGLPFTFATARSIESARVITGELEIKLPVITRNGAVLADNKTGKHLQKSIDYYKNDPSMVKAETMDEMFQGTPGYVTMIGSRETISPLYEKVKQYKGWESLFQKDTYRDEFWLEICPQNCTKAKSILKLKEQLGFEKLVVFGDSLNDISMFKIADESYAVANAMDELKKIATHIIGSNEEDSVVDLLKERFNSPSL